MNKPDLDHIDSPRHNSRTVRRMGRAKIVDGNVLCPQHRKLLGRVTPLGLELWCRGGSGHPIVLSFDELERCLPSRASLTDEQQN